MNDEIKLLKDRLGEITDRTQAIVALANDEKRDLTPEEEKTIDNCTEEFDRLEVDIKRKETVAVQASKVNAGTGRRSEPAPISNSNTAVLEQPKRGDNGLRNTTLPTNQERGRYGFAHIGEFFSAVKSAGMNGAVDQRLIKNLVYQSEGIGEDGGFTVPPDWRAEISSLLLGEDSILARCDQQTTSSNSIVLPVDEQAPWYAAGVHAYWLDEGGLKTESYSQLSLMTVRANKIAAFVKMSDELLEDSSAMGSYIQRKAPAAIQWEVSNAIINGSGTGKPLGILNSPALVVVAKETSQVAATIVPANITKMYGRMMDRWRRNAVWFINQDLEQQLMSMTTIVKNVAGTENVGGGWPLYMPAGGLSATPFGTLMGRPVIPTETCAAVGTQGDIIFADMDMYLALVKGGMKQDVSIHVEFQRDLTTFRFVLRVGGQPWLSAPITRASGGNTLSAFVTLAART